MQSINSDIDELKSKIFNDSKFKVSIKQIFQVYYFLRSDRSNWKNEVLQLKFKSLEKLAILLPQINYNKTFPQVQPKLMTKIFPNKII